MKLFRYVMCLMLLYSSIVVGMGDGILSKADTQVVHGNATFDASNSRIDRYFSTVHSQMPIVNKKKQMPFFSNKRGEDVRLLKEKFLNNAVEEQVKLRTARAQAISDKFDEQLVGVGDQSSWSKQIIFTMGLYRYTDTDIMITELNKFINHVPLNRAEVSSIVEINSMFGCFLKTLIGEAKDLKAQLFKSWATFSGKQIDMIFDEQFPYNTLHSSLQRYIQFELEEELKKELELPDEPNVFMKYVLERVLSRKDYFSDSTDSARALFQSETLKRYDKLSKDKFRPRVCALFEKLCLREDISHVNGEFCKNERKQGCYNREQIVKID